MQITIFSFLMAVFWSSILIVLLYLFRKKSVFIEQFGISSMMILYVFCAVRMAFPSEFSFTQVIPVGQIYNPVYKAFHIKVFTAGQKTVELWALVMMLWIGVAAILLLCFTVRYQKYTNPLSRLTSDKNGKAKIIFEKVKAEHKCKLNIEVIFTTGVNHPMGIGIFKKRILLPKDAYTDKQLYYILKHEYTHFLNRDLLVKMLVQVFCYIFWWNPFVYLLRKNLAQILEIKCDLRVVETMDAQERTEYLSTIVSIIKKDKETKVLKSPATAAALFENKKKSNLEERFTYVSKAGTTKRKVAFSRIASLLVLCLFVFLSYFFIFQSQFVAPIEEIETAPGTREVDPNQMYVIVDTEGNYFLVNQNGLTTPIKDIEQYREMFEQEGIEIIEEEN